MRGLEKNCTRWRKQTDISTDISTDGHGNSMKNSAQWGRVGENSFFQVCRPHILTHPLRYSILFFFFMFNSAIPVKVSINYCITTSHVRNVLRNIYWLCLGLSDTKYRRPSQVYQISLPNTEKYVCLKGTFKQQRNIISYNLLPGVNTLPICYCSPRTRRGRPR